jgi:hypothetical protein
MSTEVSHNVTRRHHPCCCLPSTLVAVAIALATVAIIIVVACHPHCCCNYPLGCHCLHLPAALVAITPPWVGEGRTIPIRCTILLWLPLLVLPSLLPPLPPVQLAGRGQSNDARDSNPRQTTCTNVAGLLSVFV